MKMRILRNYLLKDVLSSFSFSLTLLTLIMVMGNLINISDMIIRKNLPISNALSILGVFVPYIIKYTAPLAFLLGILLTFGRLTSYNELLAIQSCGISIYRLTKSLSLVGIILSLTLIILNDKIIPKFHYYYRYHIKQIASKNIGALIEPGIMTEIFQDNTVIKVGDVKNNQLKNIFIFRFDENTKQNTRIYAKRGSFILENGRLKIRLENGFRETATPKNVKDSYRLNFKATTISLPLKNQENSKIEKKEADMTLKELKERINYLKEKNNVSEQDIPEYLLELHERISFSFSPLVLMLLGIGVSLKIKQRAKSINLGLAIFAGLAYYLLFIIGKTLCIQKGLPAIWAMWLPNIIIGSIGIYLIYRNVHPK